MVRIARKRRFALRCSELEWQTLERLATEDGITPSELLRGMLREAARARGLWPRVAKEEQHG